MKQEFDRMIARCDLRMLSEQACFQTIHTQNMLFGKEEEYGLLNRLDTDTS